MAEGRILSEVWWEGPSPSASQPAWLAPDGVASKSCLSSSLPLEFLAPTLSFLLFSSSSVLCFWPQRMQIKSKVRSSDHSEELLMSGLALPGVLLARLLPSSASSERR